MSNKQKTQEQLVPEFKMIECRQLANSSTSFTQKGCDFQTIIPDGVQLKNGESLSVASCFLDTISNDSGLIELENNDPTDPSNCIISASFMYYMADIPTTNEARYRGDHDEAPAKGGGAAGSLLPPIVPSKTYSPNRALGTFDGEIYVACSKNVLNPANPVVTIDGLNLTFDNNFIRNQPSKAQKAFPYWFELNLQITDLDGVTTELVQYVLLRPAKGKNTGSNDIIMSLFDEGNKLLINNTFFKFYDQKITEMGIESQFVKRRNFGFSSLNRNEGAPNADIKLLFPQSTLGEQGITNLGEALITSDVTHGGNQHFRPIIGNVTMNLPVTTYGADELAQRIGREFSKVDQKGRLINQVAKDNLVANDLLKSAREMRQDLADAGKASDEVHFIRARDGQSTFQLNTKREIVGGESLEELQNYYVGSSQFGLIYDDETSKMSIDLMHTSFLDVSQRDGGGLPETRVYRNSQGEVFVASTYSGVILTDLQPTQLWKNAFKFDLANLLTGYREVNLTIDTVNSVVPVFDIFDGQDNSLVAGKNITTELGSMDGCVVKKRTGASGGAPTDPDHPTAQTVPNTACFDLVPPFPEINLFIDYFASIQQDHIGIFGKGQVSNNSYGGDGSNEGLGYYQIEVDINGVSTDMKGKDIYNNKIMSVISKYYSSTNYLSSYDEGSTQFYYKGEYPLNISKVHIRVLDPDGTVANINQDNTIFIKLQKGK